ncbi:MAG: AAA family ATPase [Anaerolineales bacterium]|nr:AAA family ATPase [Anaerolineales bacterium]
MDQPASPRTPSASTPWQRPPSKTDIVSKRNRPLARLGRFIRAILPWALLAGWIYWCWVNPVVLEVTLFILSWAFRIAFAIAFAVVQFVAIFWFMSQTKMETIRPEDPKSITLKDYWGQPNLVTLVRQWISLLSDREQFVKMGGRFINGILLYGPPGTGKTMLAKAMAGEAGIPFISVEGSGFRGMFWGVDVLRMMQFVRRAKKLAREYGACIAYIDEIDAVGMSRGGVMGGMVQSPLWGGFSGALTRLLYEMDGIEDKPRLERWLDRWYQFIGKAPTKKNWHVLFMGSTNRPDVLDPALLRPGRFDTKIQVDPPDKAGRREIIKGYLRKVKHDETVNIEAIVEDTPRATPAQIAAAITKDAVRLALFSGRDRISQRDIDDALQEQALGIEQPIEEWDPVQRRVVAYHEAGHAVAQHYLMPDKRIVRLTIVRRGGALGYMLPVNRVEIYGEPLRRIAAEIMVYMAGHVSVKIFMGEHWTGAWGDNSGIRWNIWKLYSLGYFGPPVLGWENSSSNGIPAHAVPLIDRFWRQLEDQTEMFLREHQAEVEALTEALLKKGSLSHEEVMQFLGDNGWEQGTDTAFPRLREPVRLPAPSPQPTPLPAPAVVPVRQTAVSAQLTPPGPTGTSGSGWPLPQVARPQMLRPPTPQDIARRRLPAEPVAKPAETSAAAQPADLSSR